MKAADKTLEKIQKEMQERKDELEKMRPHLDRHLKNLQMLDEGITSLEEKKQKALLKMSEILDLAMVTTHSLTNGYTVKPSNKHKVEIVDIAKFLIWLKENKSPVEVMEFFKTGIKTTALKKFCEVEFNEQRIKGEMIPKIEGINFGNLTFRKLTTIVRKGKK